MGAIIINRLALLARHSLLAKRQIVKETKQKKGLLLVWTKQAD